VEIADFVTQRPWRLVVLLSLPLVAMAATLALSAREPAAYEATARFAVRAPAAANSPIADAQAAERVARAVTSAAVQDEVGTTEPGSPASVSARRDGDVVVVRVETSDSAGAARSRARALVRAAVGEVYAPDLEKATAARRDAGAEASRAGEAQYRLDQITARQQATLDAADAGTGPGAAVSRLGVIARRAVVAGALGLLGGSLIVAVVSSVHGSARRSPDGGRGSELAGGGPAGSGHRALEDEHEVVVIAGHPAD
jgi:hypothetical protein